MPTLRRSDLFYRPRRWHKPVAIAIPVAVAIITAGMLIREMIR